MPFIKKENIKGGNRRKNEGKNHSQLKSITLITLFFNPSVRDKTQLNSHNYDVCRLQDISYFIAGQYNFSFF